MLPGNTIMPRCIDFSPRMPSSLCGIAMADICQTTDDRRGLADTYFRMVFTPTLFSSEKKTKIWSAGLWREFVKKFS
jgi:hypothetical protein